MNREIHVPLREGVGVRFPRATRPSAPPSYSQLQSAPVCQLFAQEANLINYVN
jgi:hypothetical protein